MTNLKIPRFNLDKQSCKYRPALPVVSYSLANQLSSAAMPTSGHRSDGVWPEYVMDGNIPVTWLWPNVYVVSELWCFRVRNALFRLIVNAYLDS